MKNKPKRGVQAHTKGVWRKKNSGPSQQRPNYKQNKENGKKGGRGEFSLRWVSNPRPHLHMPKHPTNPVVPVSRLSMVSNKDKIKQLLEIQICTRTLSSSSPSHESLNNGSWFELEKCSLMVFELNPSNNFTKWSINKHEFEILSSRTLIFEFWINDQKGWIKA